MSAIDFRSSSSFFLLAVLLAVSSFLLQRNAGLNLADEGFLWYGAQQTARGQVPLRDFQSYDPGRYYWSAVGTSLFGSGLIGLRFSETLFQIIGLWAGLLAASRVVSGWLQLAAVGLLLTMWMIPSHKLFDHTILLCAIWVTVRLIEEPLPARVFTAGFFLAFCVFFGRNHALYNFAAQVCILLLLYFKTGPSLSTSHLGIWFAGILIGLTPIVLMLLFVPGFWASYVESFRAIFRHGANLSLPFPWPDRSSLSSMAGVTRLLLGMFLIVLPLGYLAAIALSFSMQSETLTEHALFIACALTGLFYLHHAFARADVSHLAQVIHPFTLAALSLPLALREQKPYRWGVIVALTVAALLTVGRLTPLYQRLTSLAPWEPCEGADKTLVPPALNRLVSCLRKFTAKNIAPDQRVLIAPFLPGLHPILNREPPWWDLGFYFPATTQRQKAMIQELTTKNVNWAIIADTALDGREELRFSATHHLVWKYLMENFAPVDDACVPKSMKILHRKQPLAPN
jgi:hypothetical protein